MGNIMKLSLVLKKVKSLKKSLMLNEVKGKARPHPIYLQLVQKKKKF